ncbi:MAG TPA: O-antigen ligase family protein [Pyrinomonadaceae bacterium]
MSHRTPAREPLLIVGALWPLALLAPHLPGLPRPTGNFLPWRQELLVSLLLSVTLAALLRRGVKNQAPDGVRGFEVPLFLSAALYVSWVCLSALWAVNPTPALHLGAQWCAYFLFFVLMSRAASRPRVMRASLVSLGVSVWVLGLACVVETWLGAPLTDGNLRADLKPLLRGSGGFGELMAATAPIFAALALRVRRPRRALLCGATAALAWLATLQSLERAPFVGAVAGLLLLFVGTLFKASLRPRRLARAALLWGALALVLAAQTMPLPFGGRGAGGAAASAPTTNTLSRLKVGLSEDVNTRARLLFWGVGLEMLRAHPLLGVGGNNYEVAFAEARARFSARHPTSPLVGMNEDLLAVYAHNEYVQMLAELGAVGLLLFVLLSCLLVAAFVRALKHPSRALVALGCAGGMLAFAVSSGASASSFRYFGGGLVFFFAAAFITNAARHAAGRDTRPTSALFARGLGARRATAVCALALALATTLAFNLQAASAILCGMAERSADATRAESFYLSSLRLNGGSAPAHFNYGMWLSHNGRAADSVPHLRFAVARGLNSTLCYSYLAGAEEGSGDLAAAERTLAAAVVVYPRSVFLRVRHASALARLGRTHEAELEMASALLLNSRAANGWRKLIDDDIDAASEAARLDPDTYARPGELQPGEAVFAVLRENERRFPAAARTGLRARVRPN